MLDQRVPGGLPAPVALVGGSAWVPVPVVFRCFKGYQDILVRELTLTPAVVRYRRERWATPSGRRRWRPCRPARRRLRAGAAPLPLVAHATQVTTERLVALLAGIGIEISKRQVVRLLTSRLDDLIAEDREDPAGRPWPRISAEPGPHLLADFGSKFSFLRPFSRGVRIGAYLQSVLFDVPEQHDRSLQHAGQWSAGHRAGRTGPAPDRAAPPPNAGAAPPPSAAALSPSRHQHHRATQRLGLRVAGPACPGGRLAGHIGAEWSKGVHRRAGHGTNRCQPPWSGGSRRGCRVVTVPQSLTCRLMFTPARTAAHRRRHLSHAADRRDVEGW